MLLQPLMIKRNDQPYVQAYIQNMQIDSRMAPEPGQDSSKSPQDICKTAYTDSNFKGVSMHKGPTLKGGRR